MSNSLVGLVRSIVHHIFAADFGLVGVYAYTVAECDGETLSGSPVSSKRKLPTIVKVPLTPGILGGTAEIKPGSIVLVVFTDGDRSSPQVVFSELGAHPKTVTIEATEKATVNAPLVALAGGGPGAARMGDPVVCGPFVGAITQGSLKTTIG